MNVTDLLRALAAGDKTLDEVKAAFASVKWAKPVPTPVDVDIDDIMDQPENTIRAIGEAYGSGLIDAETFAELRLAATAAGA